MVSNCVKWDSNLIKDMTHNIIFQDLETGLQVIVTDDKETDSNAVREVALITASKNGCKLISITQTFEQ